MRKVIWTAAVLALCAAPSAAQQIEKSPFTPAPAAAQHLRIVEAGKVRLEIGDGLATRVRDRFDRILLNGACPEIPHSVTSLLGPGGRLVGALAMEGLPRLVSIDRSGDELRQELGQGLRISPLVTGVAVTL